MGQDTEYLLSEAVVDAYLQHPPIKVAIPYTIYPSGFSHGLAELLMEVKGDYSKLLGRPEFGEIQRVFVQSISRNTRSDPILMVLPFCDKFTWDPGHWFSIVIRGNPEESTAFIAAYDSLGYFVKSRVHKKGSQPPEWKILYDTVGAILSDKLTANKFIERKTSR
jgi:hypothetical protein